MPQPPLDHDLGVKLERLLASDPPDWSELCDMDSMIARRWRKDDPDALPLEARRYMAAWDLDGQVCNGGFYQFFFNCGPNVAVDALDYARDRNLSTLASLIERAFAVVLDGEVPQNSDDLRMLVAQPRRDADEECSSVSAVSPERESPREMLARFVESHKEWDDAFRSIDDAYYEYERGADLTRDRLRYALEKRAVFFFPA